MSTLLAGGGPMFGRLLYHLISVILAAGLLAACGAPAPSATATPLPTRVYAPEPEADFALYFTYGACLAETLDTFQGTFSRSMCPPDPPLTISFALSAEEMRTIYLEMAKIDFSAIPTSSRWWCLRAPSTARSHPANPTTSRCAMEGWKRSYIGPTTSLSRRPRRPISSAPS
jgi:hypothetical protein